MVTDFKRGAFRMKETKPEIKETYEKPEVFKEGNLTDITAGGTIKPND